jgi:hypothetical protein
MKKLLLILIALPLIGFGQDDKIIFSSGDTIYGKVIEVGVNDITYQHKDETTNNVSKKKELAKVIYSSGRIETFQGLSILESKIEREENDKLYLQQKDERNKIRKQKRTDFKRSLELGFFTGITSSFISKEYKELLGGNRVSYVGTTLLNPDVDIKSLYPSNVGISLKYNISNLISLNTNLMYQTKGAKLNSTEIVGGFGVLEYSSKLKNYYITLPIITKFNFNKNFSLNAGIYSSYLIEIIQEVSVKGTDIDFFEINQLTDNQNNGYQRFDFGLILGNGFSYALNNKTHFTFDANLEYGLIKISRLKNSHQRYNIGYNFQLGCSYRLKQ